MARVTSMRDALARVIELIPESQSLIDAHRADFSEFGPVSDEGSGVIPYSFFTDLRYFVFGDPEDDKPLDERKLTGLYLFIEEALESTDEDVRDGISIRLVNKLAMHKKQAARASSKPGSKLSALLAELDQ